MKLILFKGVTMFKINHRRSVKNNELKISEFIRWSVVN